MRRVRCPEDRRQVLCHVTEAARRLLAGLDRPVAEAGRGLLAPLDPARTAELIRLLDAVRLATASSTNTDSKRTETKKKRK